MAKRDTVTEDTTVTEETSTNGTTSVAPEFDDSDFQEIVTERYMYNAGKCGGAPLVGYLLNRLSMPKIRGREWDAFLIKTVLPTKAVNREKKVVDVEVGQEVLIPATYTLMQFLSRAAANETGVFLVRIVPDKKVEIGGGQTMWTFKLAARPKPFSRAAFGLVAALGVPQLPAAGETTGGDEELDAPF